MIKLVALLFVVAVAKSESKFCETKNAVPDLIGKWICSDKWLNDVVPTPMENVNLTLMNDGSGTTASKFLALPSIPGVSTSRSFVYKMPKYYVAIGVKIDIGDKRFSNAKLYYWDDITFDNYSRTNEHWHLLGIEDGNKNGIIKFTGFSRLSRYWKIVLENDKIISVKNIAFNIIARITSGTDLTGDYDISFQSELGKEIEPEQLDPSNYANVDAAPTNHECNYVRRPPADIVRRHRLDTSFYTKYTQAYGVPVLANHVVDDRALKRACYTVRFMLSDNKGIRDHMYYNKGRVTIIGRHQQVPWTPEYRHLRGWTHRAAGGTYEIPVTVGAEENVLCERGDPFGPAQDILMHEFAHGVQLIAARTAIPDFTSRLQRNWLYARSQGKWRNTYANTNNIEYFAECTQVFFNQQRLGPAGGDGIQNDINTRAKLLRYDPGMYKLVQEIYPCASTDYIHRCQDKDQTRGVNQQFKMNCSPGGGGGTGTGTGGCQDKEANCQYWKDQGHCTGGEWVQYMETNCPKSCNKCPTTTTTTKPVTVKPTGGCEDTKENCNYWLGEGYCTSDEWGSWMAENCPKSCGKCNTVTTTTETVTPPPITTTKPNPVDCKDLKDNCAYWKGEGHCDSDEWGSYMTENCPVSCDKCKTVTTTTEIITPPPITTTKPNPTECEDLKDNCAYWKGEGHCDSEEWGSYMTENCPVSCNKCKTTTTKPTTVTSSTEIVTPPPITTTKPTKCEDTKENCNYWLGEGYCTSDEWGSWMAENCPKSCGKCNTVTTTTKIVTPPPITTTTPTTTTVAKTTTTEPAECKDVDKDCFYYLNQGYCTEGEYVDWMVENCAKSCDKCGGVSTTTILTPPPLTTTTGSVVTTTSVTPPPNTTTKSTTRRQCNDNNASCVSWKIYCNSNQYVKNNCKSTCGTC